MTYVQLIAKNLIRGVIVMALFTSMLLIPAGTWHWARGNQFLIAYGVMMITTILVFARWVPANLEARTMGRNETSQPLADRLISSVFRLTIIGWLIFASFDANRWHLLPPPPFWLALLGAGVAVCGWSIMIVAIFQNAYAAPIVMDQSERGQVVIDTGLYSFVRHPLYLGLLLLPGLSLWLESYAALAVYPLFIAFIVGRTHVEEKFLRQSLDGYPQYMQRVRYRLLPHVW